MRWTILTFGRYAGKTLPEILLTDPDWFWFMSSKFYGRLRDEADELNRRARAIRIPKKKPFKFEIEYRYDRDGRLEGVCVVRVGSPKHSKHADRQQYLDLLAPIGREAYDKRTGRVIVRDFRKAYFGEDTRITKDRCIQFFSNDANFLYA